MQHPLQSAEFHFGAGIRAPETTLPTMHFYPRCPPDRPASPAWGTADFDAIGTAVAIL